MKERLLKRPTNINELSFDELYDEISKDWQSKALNLQARRWRAFKANKDGGLRKVRIPADGLRSSRHGVRYL